MITEDGKRWTSHSKQDSIAVEEMRRGHLNNALNHMKGCLNKAYTDYPNNMRTGQYYNDLYRSIVVLQCEAERRDALKQLGNYARYKPGESGTNTVVSQMGAVDKRN